MSAGSFSAAHPDSVPDEETVREKIALMLMESPVEISPFDLLEQLAGDNVAEEEVKSALTAMLAESKVIMTPMRKLLWNYAAELRPAGTGPLTTADPCIELNRRVAKAAGR